MGERKRLQSTAQAFSIILTPFSIYCRDGSSHTRNHYGVPQREGIPNSRTLNLISDPEGITDTNATHSESSDTVRGRVGKHSLVSASDPH